MLPITLRINQVINLWYIHIHLRVPGMGTTSSPWWRTQARASCAVVHWCFLARLSSCKKTGLFFSKFSAANLGWKCCLKPNLRVYTHSFVWVLIRHGIQRIMNETNFWKCDKLLEIKSSFQSCVFQLFFFFEESHPVV